MKPDRGAWNLDRPIEVSAYYHTGDPVVRARKPLTDKPKAAELFCGCGGFSAGFEMAGFECVLGADIHKPSIATFARNHPGASTVLGDLRTVASETVQELCVRNLDVLLAGIPCQGFSLNNRKRHSHDKRNFLFEELLRFVQALQPQTVVVENVTGLRSANGGSFVEAIEQGFQNLGYQVHHRVLNAAHYGVPQTRSRVVFVAIRSSEPFSWPCPTHGPNLQPLVTVAEAIGDLPPLTHGHSADRYSRAPATAYQLLMRQGGIELLNHQAPKHPEATVQRIARTVPGQPMYVAFKQRIRLDPNAPSPTQVSGGIRPQFQFGHPDQARGLTVRERCRIQSFPDRYFIEGGTVQGRVQTGNAVPPLLAKAIAEAVLAHLRVEARELVPH